MNLKNINIVTGDNPDCVEKFIKEQALCQTSGEYIITGVCHLWIENRLSPKQLKETIDSFCSDEIYKTKINIISTFSEYVISCFRLNAVKGIVDPETIQILNIHETGKIETFNPIRYNDWPLDFMNDSILVIEEITRLALAKRKASKRV